MHRSIQTVTKAPERRLNEEGETAREALRKRDVPEKRWFKIAFYSALATLILSLAVGAVELRSLPKLVKEEAGGDKGIPTLPPLSRKMGSPLSVLPDKIIQFTVKAHHEVPGAVQPAAEAIYESTDMNLALATPINTYAKVTLFESSERARADVDMTISQRYPGRQDSRRIGNIMARTAYDKPEGSFFIGWTYGNYSVKLFTSFTRVIPQQKEGKLEGHALRVAEKIVEHNAGK